MKHIQYQTRYPDAILLSFNVPGEVQYLSRNDCLWYLEGELPGMEILEWNIRGRWAEVTVRKRKQLTTAY
jgi:hypothetical protein